MSAVHPVLRLVLIRLCRLLTGQKIATLADAFVACRWFHEQRGVPTVVITSINLEKDSIDIVASTTAFECAQAALLSSS